MSIVWTWSAWSQWPSDHAYCDNGDQWCLWYGLLLLFTSNDSNQLTVYIDNNLNLVTIVSYYHGERPSLMLWDCTETLALLCWRLTTTTETECYTVTTGTSDVEHHHVMCPDQWPVSVTTLPVICHYSQVPVETITIREYKAWTETDSFNCSLQIVSTPNWNLGM